MTELECLVNRIKKWPILYSFLIVPFYFARFLYYSLKEKSLWFYRYHPGHFHSTIPSKVEIDRNADSIFTNKTATDDGIDLNEKEQLKLLGAFSEYYSDFPFFFFY